MPNIAVKFWKSCPDKHPDMPDEWPWMCQEIGDEKHYEDGKDSWVVMSFDDYHSYIEKMQPLYDKYQSHIPPLAEPPTELEQVKAELEAIKEQVSFLLAGQSNEK